MKYSEVKQLLFFYCCLDHNLWLATFSYYKPKTKNDTFDYRFETQPETTKRKEKKKDVIGNLSKLIKEGDDEHNPNLS